MTLSPPSLASPSALSFLVTCTAVKESAAKRPFKKVIATKGTPPEQYPDYEE